MWTPTDPDAITDQVEALATAQGLTLYPHQSEALLELVTGANVILATPTGSGKSLVALAAHLAAVESGRRSYYTAPIKALVNEKFFALCEVLGRERVGMMTGDAAVNPDAPVICCTAEVLANLALRRGADAEVDQVVMDEFHFYADPDRGWAWQVPLLELPNAQFLLMSATLGDVSFFAESLTSFTGRPTAVIDDAARPVPLDFRYVRSPVHETIETLMEQDEAPIYVVHFTQAEAFERAQSLTSTVNPAPQAKEQIAALVGPARLTTSFGTALSRLLRHGIGVHHAGMLPRYRRLVEQLAQRGLLRVICGTDTLGVGINVPIRTVLFTALGKYDGTRNRQLSAREFHQIAGRAGRAGFDTHGLVVSEAPDHEVLNAHALKKAGDDPKKRRKVQRKAPAPGSVNWTEQTFERMIGATPEPLASQMRITHGMVLDVIDRPGDPWEAMRHLLRDNHSPRPAQNRMIRATVAIVRSLMAAGVVERLPQPEPDGRRYRLTVDLPDDFALNQALSTFALAALELLDADSPEFALDVVSVIEATLENPRAIIRAQTDRAKSEAVAQLKADGVEYEERMERLAEITHPQPLRDLLETAYDSYRRGHPWVLDHELQPKSVVREMVEQGMGFADLVRFYGLTRSEGGVLRYLSDAYRALRTGVPSWARTTEVEDLVEWLGEVVRQTDSSLLDEWNALADNEVLTPESVAAETAPPVTRNLRAFRAMVRTAMFRRVTLLAREDYAGLAELEPAGSGRWSADRWADAFDPFWDDHDELRTDADARGPSLFTLDEAPDRLLLSEFGLEEGRWWVARQTLADPEGDHDWAITAVVDLDASDDEGAPVTRVVALGS